MIPKHLLRNTVRKFRHGIRARQRQLLTLLFNRRWTGKPLRSEYEADKEMSRLFEAPKGVARYWILRLRRSGLVDRWSLNRKGSMEFWKSLVREAAETLTDPEKNATPANEDLQRRVSLIIKVGRRWGVSLTPKLREDLMGSHKYYREEFGDKHADVLLHVYDMAFGQFERETEHMKRIFMFPLLLP
jgi:hypothetical protein